MTLGHLLSTPNVMRCEKCRFATTDIAEFKKHMAREHIEYYCFYCNSVSLSEAELQAHLKIHTATSPFKCPHCGQVYMRRMCLIKHIERFHSKIVSQGSPKIDSTSTTTPHISVSSASQSVSCAADSSSQRPAVRVTVPTPNATGFRLDPNFQRLKSLNSYLSNVSHGDTVPLNGHVQRNRALTVSLPEEVSIPAGCMVEVAEVKTVDGTKELRLRFVAHQEKESVTKNGRTAVPETSKVLSSPTKFHNTASESEMRTVNNKNHETKTLSKEHPTLLPGNISKSLQNSSVKEQCRKTKRPPPEVINLDVPDVPSKISRTFIPVGESKIATHVEPINHTVTPVAISSVFGSRLIAGSVQPENLSPRICPRGVEERRGFQERTSSTASIMTNNVQSTPHVISTNRGPVTVKASEGTLLPKNKREPTKPQQQSSKTQFLPSIPSVVAAPQIRVSNECKDNFAPKTFFPQQDSSQKTSIEPALSKNPTKTSNIHVKLSALPQEVKVENIATPGVRGEREGFPVISSVYSLSRQPDDPPESSQPIVMAEWTNSAGRDGLKFKSIRSEQSKITSGHQVQTDSKDGNLSQNILPKKITCESVKVERDQCIQLRVPETPNSVHVKNEKSTSAKEKKCKNSKTCSSLKKHVHTAPLIPESSLVSEKFLIQKPETESSSKVLTVSLKRVQVGIWKKSKKKRKAVVSKSRSPNLCGDLRDCTILQLMPLREDQAVKQPSPNQPVVVLNYLQPNVHQKRTTTNSRTNKGASVAPKCQILKIKLSKVSGQSYEVMGCTVQNLV